MEKKFFSYRFESLDVYQLARKFRVEIKKLSMTFPADEKFELNLMSYINIRLAKIKVSKPNSIKTNLNN